MVSSAAYKNPNFSLDEFSKYVEDNGFDVEIRGKAIELLMEDPKTSSIVLKIILERWPEYEDSIQKHPNYKPIKSGMAKQKKKPSQLEKLKEDLSD